ncbi:MAG: outer membrane protein OmpW, partial [Gammaproteobacteria bacterium]
MFIRSLAIFCAVFCIALSQNVIAFEKGDFLIRGGSATVSPNDSTSDVDVGGMSQGFDLNVQ